MRYEPGTPQALYLFCGLGERRPRRALPLPAGGGLGITAARGSFCPHCPQAQTAWFLGFLLVRHLSHPPSGPRRPCSSSPPSAIVTTASPARPAFDRPGRSSRRVCLHPVSGGPAHGVLRPRPVLRWVLFIVANAVVVLVGGLALGHRQATWRDIQL